MVFGSGVSAVGDTQHLSLARGSWPERARASKVLPLPPRRDMLLVLRPSYSVTAADFKCTWRVLTMLSASLGDAHQMISRIRDRKRSRAFSAVPSGRSVSASWGSLVARLVGTWGWAGVNATGQRHATMLGAP